MSFVSSIPVDDESVSAVMGRYMDQTKALFELTQLIMRTGECDLSVGQRELIAAFTSSLNNCDYCYDTHRSTAEAFGVDKGLLERLVEDIDAAAIDPDLIPVLHYVKKLTQTPSKMVQADADKIFSAGWSENDFHYIVMACALFSFFNRMIEGYGVKNVTDYRVARGKAIAENGYDLAK